MEWLYPLPRCSHSISIHKTRDSSFQLGTSLSGRIAPESIVPATLSLHLDDLHRSCTHWSSFSSSYSHPTSSRRAPHLRKWHYHPHSLWLWRLDVFSDCPGLIRHQVAESSRNISQIYIFYYIFNDFVLFRSSFPLKNNILKDSELPSVFGQHETIAAEFTPPPETTEQLNKSMKQWFTKL